jgi:hypothetical protein
MGFEHAFPVFERTKTFYALDRAATLIGNGDIRFLKFGRPTTRPGLQTVTGTNYKHFAMRSRET